MPFGMKLDGSGRMIDFDLVYRSIIVGAIDAAGLEAIRADEEVIGGSIHKPMFERLMLCEYAVADLTAGNPNVLYELGIRHALRPRSTTIIFNEGSPLPFDLTPLRGVPYRLDAAAKARSILAQRLTEARQCSEDSPVYQFLAELPRPEIDHAKTDIFRGHVDYAKKMKERLAEARGKGESGLQDIRAIRGELGNLLDAQTGTVVDVYLSLRAIAGAGKEAYAEMVSLYADMPLPLQRTRMVREQLAFGLNRLGRYSEAEQVLNEIIRENGPSPETNGLLGRVFKDQYESAGKTPMARGFLNRAIDAYLAGFEADWRDAYPGVNAVTLMELKDPPDPRQAVLLPIVRYAAVRRVTSTGGDYWDHATLLELAVLARDTDAAYECLASALAIVKDRREIFAPQTTARNLRLIRERREARGEACPAVAEIEQHLEAVAKQLERGEP
jgi:tetratricopeptide (TPR) repeat protein